MVKVYKHFECHYMRGPEQVASIMMIIKAQHTYQIFSVSDQTLYTLVNRNRPSD